MYEGHEDGEGSLLSRTMSGPQCDQMGRLFFNTLAFATMNICTKPFFCQSRLKNAQTRIKPIKKYTLYY